MSIILSSLYAFEMTLSINVRFNPMSVAIRFGISLLCCNTLLLPHLNNAVIYPIATKHARYNVNIVQ